MITNFKTFMQHLIIENLHPELQHIVKSVNKNYAKSKQVEIAKKIKDLTSRGEKTGIEGNMPKGSSRAYLQHEDTHDAIVDGKPEKLKTGTKVAIKSALDPYHKKHYYEDHSLGALQNKAEGGDHWVNKNYRILSKDHETGHYHSNKDSGIFPPLIDHDHEHNEWTHVGHARDIKKDEFQNLTKTESHPKGITHREFAGALVRQYDRNNGKHWNNHPNDEKRLDHIDEHPLVQKFHDYHNNTGHPPHDLTQLKNMGIYEHPDGSKHIVARDHGFDSDVAKAYSDAKRNKYAR